VITPQALHGLSDGETVDAVTFDLRWKAACGLRSPRRARLLLCRCRRPVAAGLPAFTRHTITSPDVLRQRLSVIRLTQMATSRNEFECGKAAITMPIFYGAGRVAAAIELTVGNLALRE
jgi:DNA-binding IclR family transcriptional regulator